MRRSRPWGSLDQALERLRVHGLPYRWCAGDLRLWEAVCPACRTPELALHLREPYRGAEISLRCASGCSAGEISTALKREPVDIEVENAVQLAEDASAIAHRTLELKRVAA